MQITKLDERIIKDLAEFQTDPLGAVLYAFPWGEENTPLATFPEPLEWQVELFLQIKHGLIDVDRALQLAVSSGHGIGKSAFISMIIWWAMSTRRNTRGIVTAGTENQLVTKTQPEVAKWFRMAVNSSWFEVKSTKVFHKMHPESWRMDFIPWSENNPDAFAGLHNEGNRILVVFDEGSSIAQNIWETIRGALTDADTEIIWLVCGNPVRNTGEFRECFGKNKHRWVTRQIDSRSVSITNKNIIQDWVDDYGEDSDFIRVRVRGVFPRAGTNQLISQSTVDAARLREHVAQRSPFVIGVDVARFGDDQTVVCLREGDFVHPLIKRREMDTMETASLVADMIFRYEPEAVFIDEIGIGAGVVDRLRQLGHKVNGINVGARASASDQFANVRAEVWERMNVFLQKTGVLPDDVELEQELVSVEYMFNNQGRKQLEKKEDMKKRGLASPDCADALALTFSMQMPAADIIETRRKKKRDNKRRAGDPFSLLG